MAAIGEPAFPHSLKKKTHFRYSFVMLGLVRNKQYWVQTANMLLKPLYCLTVISNGSPVFQVRALPSPSIQGFLGGG